MKAATRTVAVLGASSDRRKFGNKAVRAFASCGWRVFAVHPTETSVEQAPAFPRLADLPEPVDTITVYVPPAVARRLLPEIAAAQPREVWFNPGSADAALPAETARLKIPAIYGCSIVALGVSPGDFPAA